MSHRLHHRFYDPEVEKVVPKDAIVLDLTADQARATLWVLGDAAIEFDNEGAASSLAVLNRLRDQIREQMKAGAP